LGDRLGGNAHLLGDQQHKLLQPIEALLQGLQHSLEIAKKDSKAEQAEATPLITGLAEVRRHLSAMAWLSEQLTELLGRQTRIAGNGPHGDRVDGVMARDH
jgi:hypothetical protein